MKQILLFTAISSLCLIALFVIASLIDLQRLAQYASIILATQHNELEACVQNFSDKPIKSFQIERTDINNDSVLDGIVRTSNEACGSAGCVHELCISDGADFVHVPFGFAAHTADVSEVSTQGMRDIILNKDLNLTMSWDGSAYRLNESRAEEVY